MVFEILAGDLESIVVCKAFTLVTSGEMVYPLMYLRLPLNLKSLQGNVKADW